MNAVVMAAMGILAGLGASMTGLGGGFLIVPLLIFLGYTPARAVGTSFLGILIISLSAVFAHGKLDHVDYRLGLLLGLGGVVGAQIGARLLPHIPPPMFRKIFAVLLVTLAVQMFFKK